MTVTGLVPNALYHVRLVATNSAGTTFGQDVTFTTAMAPAPGAPTLGKTFNIKPISGLVLIDINGHLVPLTELTQLPPGVAIDTLHGTLELITSTGGGGGGAHDAAVKTQHGEFSGAVFRLSQQTGGAGKGLVTIMLALSAFKGAPSQSICKSHGTAADATAASSRTIQLLHASAHGKFRTSGRYSAATVLGTIWTVSGAVRRDADPCDQGRGPGHRLRPPQDDHPPRRPELSRARPIQAAMTGPSSTRASPRPDPENLLR